MFRLGRRETRRAIGSSTPGMHLKIVPDTGRLLCARNEAVRRPGIHGLSLEEEGKDGINLLETLIGCSSLNIYPCIPILSYYGRVPEQDHIDTIMSRARAEGA